LDRVYFTGSAPHSGADVFTNADSATVYYLPGTGDWGTSFANRPAVLWNPVLNAPTYALDASGFAVTVSSTTAIPIAVEACTNLADPAWLLVLTTNLASGSLSFCDPDSTNHATRFYRVAAP